MSETEISSRIASGLLQIKAIKLNPESPFRWASGILSPIYCDNRITLSHPALRSQIRQYLAERIVQVYGKPEVIAGVATAAIAHGVMIAEELNLPFCYVRSAPKDHGMKNLIEGEIPAGKKVVVIEDLVSTGLSSLKAVDALKDAGCQVIGMAAVFTYGLPVAEKNFLDAGCRLVTLTKYEDVIQLAANEGFVPVSMLETLKQWKNSPETWNPSIITR